METKPVGFFSRLVLALRVLFASGIAEKLVLALTGETAARPLLEDRKEEAATPRHDRQADYTTGAKYMLALLQREGRFVDFLQEEVSGFTDSEIGAAARVVHSGCQKVLRQYLELEPVRREAEGTSIVLEKGFDPVEIRLTGNVRGEPPFRGTLTHPGWRARETRLPSLSENHNPSIIAPAEVEL